MRSTVCHVIDPASPGGGACTLRLLAELQTRLPSFRHEVIVLGTARHVALALQCGVRSVHQVPLLQPQPAIARRGLRRWIDAYETAHGPLSLVHAWTPCAARLAILAAAHRKRLATFTLGPTSALDAHRLMQLFRLHPMPIVVSFEAVAEEYRTIGLDVPMFAALHSGVDPDSTKEACRDALRRAWEIDEHTFVVGLFSEPATWGDAEIAIEMIARSAMTGCRARLLLHPAAHRRMQGERRLRALFDDELLIMSDDVAEPWRVMSGVDAALMIGGRLNTSDLSRRGWPFAALTGGGQRVRPMPGIGPLLYAMAAGVPVVAEAGGAVCEIIEGGTSGLLIKPGDVNAASDLLMKLHDDPTLAKRIGDAGRCRVKRAFHIQAFCDRLEKAYQDEAVIR